MAWIESHQSLANHRKTRALSRLLKKDRPTVIGHLHLVWWWCLDNAQDGNLTGINHEDLADAAMWKGNPEVFFQALMDAGFIDKDTKTLHDWMEYQGNYVDTLSLTKEQKKAGGKARMASLNPEQRSEMGRKAAETRWNRQPSTHEIPAEIPAEAKNDTSSIPGTVPTVPTVPYQQDSTVITPTPSFSSLPQKTNLPGDGEQENIYALYEKQVGPLTGYVSEQLKAVEEDFTNEEIIDVIHATHAAGEKTWAAFLRHLETVRIRKISQANDERLGYALMYYRKEKQRLGRDLTATERQQIDDMPLEDLKEKLKEPVEANSP